MNTLRSKKLTIRLVFSLLVFIFASFTAVFASEIGELETAEDSFSPSDIATPAQVTEGSPFNPESKFRNPEALQSELASSEKVRVIVKLSVPDYTQLQARSASFKAISPEDAASPMAPLRAAQALAADQALASSIHAVADSVTSALADTGAVQEQKFNFVPFAVYTVDQDALDKLAARPEVLTVEVDELSRVPERPEISDAQLDRPQLSGTTTLIGADTVWGNGYTGSGWYVAVLDTGIRTSHEFFSGKTIVEACFTTAGSSNPSTTLCPNSTDSQTGTGAAAHYYSLQNIDSGWDHGTHVAGISSGNNGTLKGVAPDSDIIAVNVFSDGFTSSSCGGASNCVLSYTSDQVSGLEYVYGLRNTYSIASVNMSLGGGAYSSSCDSASQKSAIDLLRDAGIATAIASGNSGYCGYVGSPSCISTSVAVGASDDSDTIASFSNWETDLVPLFAPGVSIYSSTADSDSSYESWNGTSMATPHVAGAWALLKQKSPTATVDSILSALTTTGKSVTFDRCSNPTGITRRIQVDDASNNIGGSISLPTVTTTTPTSVTASTATGGGEVTDNGNGTVFERGVCWGTSTSPTILDNKTNNGRENGTFTSYLTNLSGGTTYYVRAYATNAAGTAYGSEVSFTTGSSPTVTSFTPTSGTAGDTIAITGTNFASVSQVSFGGTAASSFTVNSTTSISAVLGAGTSGTVSVATSDGTGTSSSSFTYSGSATAPSISSFRPGVVSSNNTVVIIGENLSDATAVSFGGTAASSFTVMNENKIRADFGTGSTGLISVTTPNGTAVSSTQLFYAGEDILRFIWSQASGGKNAYMYFTGNQYGGNTELDLVIPSNYIPKTVGDFNSDGLADIVVRDPSTGETIAVILKSSFQYSSYDTLATSIADPWDIFGAGDFNSDTYSDLVLVNSSTGEVAIIYLGYSFTTSSIKRLDMSLGLEWELVAIGDMDKDGIPDLILQNDIGWVGIIHITSGFVSGTIKKMDITIPTQWKVFGTWDFNNDGLLDLALRNDTDNTLAVVYLTSTFGFNGYSQFSSTFEAWFSDGWEPLSTGDIF